jgi:alpha-D-ribose 1-methylphosphonate 5-triphosphate synthase subunit PhnG
MNLTISQMESRSLAQLSKTLSTLEIKILKGPGVGLLMMSVTDPFHTDFHMGEILAAETLVEFGGVRGYGMVMGKEPDLTVAAAAVDAISRSGALKMLNIEKVLASERERIENARRHEEALVESTRVSFESMVRG